MSTIASPREPPMRRMPSSSQTPTSSSRPSLETSRSLTSSPNPNAASFAGPPGAAASSVGGASGGTTAAATRRNRAALREYYNLKKAGGTGTGTSTPVLEVTEVLDDAELQQHQHQLQQQHNHILSYSEVPPSEMDASGFDADAYVRHTLETSSLAELLRIYTRVLGETRALDAEKKGLVYDNYSRLITATETIRKMRATMDPLNPMAATLDPAIAHIYHEAVALRDALRDAVPAGSCSWRGKHAGWAVPKTWQRVWRTGTPHCEGSQVRHEEVQRREQATHDNTRLAVGGFGGIHGQIRF
ncbi:Vps51/Vps67 [Niveomyces insectorum RCEF 264]|uniref:Vacuolar protein sorting-associated protein 51 homolog n=1 Tax=Niveomyces insectorum RCEF 264 TaxID=1081102 RepID=A0A162IAV5_9HYPO|nr:Vps51/Vps67 [Niveomyces insectorum RCEF 264]